MTESTSTVPTGETYFVVRPVPGTNSAEDVGYNPLFEAVSEDVLATPPHFTWTSHIGEAIELENRAQARDLAEITGGVYVSSKEVAKLNFGSLPIVVEGSLTSGLGLGIR